MLELKKLFGEDITNTEIYFDRNQVLDKSYSLYTTECNISRSCNNLFHSRINKKTLLQLFDLG